MAEQQAKKKAVVTPRQAEIRKLVDKGRDKRSEQESARLDQLREEEKRDRFTRLAVKRVTNAIRQLRNVGRLGNRSIYLYTDGEAARIVTALTEAMHDTAAQFESKRRDDVTFEF